VLMDRSVTREEKAVRELLGRIQRAWSALTCITNVYTSQYVTQLGGHEVLSGCSPIHPQARSVTWARVRASLTRRNPAAPP
jgi:hypothetical protein